LRRSDIPLLAEAIARMRRGEVFIQPGYDGEYGKIQIFDPSKKRGETLFLPAVH